MQRSRITPNGLTVTSAVGMEKGSVPETARDSESTKDRKVDSASHDEHSPIKSATSYTSSVVPLHVSVLKHLTGLRSRTFSRDTIKLVGSLLWTILARYPERNGKDHKRLLKSVCTLADRIEARQGKEDRWLSWLKYHLTVLLSRVLKSTVRDHADGLDVEADAAYEWGLPVPKHDDLESPFSGYLLRMVNNAVVRGDAAFVYSLLQSKRAWPVLSEWTHAKSMLDYRGYLGTQQSPLEDDAKDELRLVAQEIFGRLSKPTKFLPTGRAALNQRIKDGGNFQEVERFAPPLVNKTGPDLGTLQAELSGFNDWRQRRWEIEALKARSAGPRPSPDAPGQFVNDADALQLDEAGKIRTISLGFASAFNALQACQHQLVMAWKGMSMNTWKEDVDDKVQTIFTQMLPFRERYGALDEFAWNSGDYKAATDLLKSEATRVVLEGIPLHTEEGFAPLYARDILTATFQDGGRISHAGFADGPTGPVEQGSFTQKNGQLMGHPCSFPFLCAINLTVHRLTVKRWWNYYGDVYEHDEAFYKALIENVVINGDDILYYGPRSMFRFFREAADAVGLKISVGKNYLSTTYAMINSRLYHEEAGRMKRHGYLNLTLLLGSESKTGDTAKPDQLGRDLGEMMRYWPPAKLVLPLAFLRFKKIRAQHGFIPNWYIPVHLGGYGVPAEFAPDDLTISREQRLVAKRFILNPNLMLFQLTDSKEQFNVGLRRKVKVRTRGWYLEGQERHVSVKKALGPTAPPRPTGFEGVMADEVSDFGANLNSQWDGPTWVALPEIPETSFSKLGLRITHMAQRAVNRNLVPLEADALSLRVMVMDRARNFVRAGVPMSSDPLFVTTSRTLMRRYGRVVPIGRATDAELMRWWDPVSVTTEAVDLPPLTTLYDRPDQAGVPIHFTSADEESGFEDSDN